MSNKYQEDKDASKVDQAEDAGFLYCRAVFHDIQFLKQLSNAL